MKSTESFWHTILSETQHKWHIFLPPDTETYLSSLLHRHLTDTELGTHLTNIESLFFAPSAGNFKEKQSWADRSTLLTSLFPAHCCEQQHQPASLGQLAQQLYFHLAQELTYPEKTVFLNLHRNYDAAVRVLSLAWERPHRPHILKCH